MIEVEACSICASDVKMYRRGHRDLAYPRILGHEVVGRVVGTRTGRIHEQSRVQVWPGSACGSCPACMEGLDNLCPSVGVLGFNLDGGFAETMAVPRGCVDRGGVNPVPRGLTSDLASLTEPLACCINAQEHLGVGSGDSVVIIGGGPLGALHAMLARHRGAGLVAIVEGEAPRRGILAHADPDLVVDPKEGWQEVVRESQRGRGADAVIMATPQAPIDQRTIGLLAPRGKVSVFSGLAKEDSVTGIDVNQLHYWERSIIGSYGCRSADCREALALLASRSIDAEWLITKRLALERIIEGLAYVEARRGMKATVTRL